MPVGSGNVGERQTSAVAAVVLAAGRSSRMGAENKLLADLDGTPMVRRVAQAALASRARPVLVVTGHQAAAVGAALHGLEVTLLVNPGYATGLASSLKAGIRRVPPHCAGAAILLGDMPRIGPEHLDRLIAAFAAAPETVVVPVHAGRQGNPVLWPRRSFPQLLQLDGDTGARRLIAAEGDRVQLVDMGTDAILADADTPEDLRRLRERLDKGTANTK